MKIVLIGLGALLLIAIITAMIMGISPVKLNLHKKIFQKEGYAISGYDVVALKTENSAVKGTDRFSSQWGGATWIFSTEKHKKMFDDAPESYTPALGGYCTFAVSKGFTAPGNANFRHIENDSLYLFSNEAVKEDALKNFEAVKNSARNKWN